MTKKLVLIFNGITLSPISDKNQIWLTSVELAKSLGYADEKSVSRIFTRNKDEFSSDMTTLFQGGQFDHLGEFKGVQNGTRIFSLRGCHLIAMFAKTVIAKQFRVWVLDILDKGVGTPKPNGIDEILRSFEVQEKRDVHSPMMDALIFIRESVGKKTTDHHFTNENLFCNRALTGKWEPLDESDLDVYDLRLLKAIRLRNMILMQHNLKQADRKDALDKYVTTYLNKTPRLKLVISK